MFKQLNRTVWAFDVEWVPDPDTGRRLLQLPEDQPDMEVVQAMWKAGDATEEEQMPYLKTMICRVFSIAAVVRNLRDDGFVLLSLTSLPHHPKNPKEQQEAVMFSTFLNTIGDKKAAACRFQFTSCGSDDSRSESSGQRCSGQGICTTSKKP